MLGVAEVLARTGPGAFVSSKERIERVRVVRRVKSLTIGTT
jgi:hypothetical protein